MARKAAPQAPGQGMLLDLVEVEETHQPSVPAPLPLPSEPQKAQEPLKVILEPVSVPPECATEASDSGPMATCTLGVKDGYWTVSGMVLGDGGEVLASLESQGIVTADGVQHSGWILAAMDAMQKVQAFGPVTGFDLWIPDHFSVGFLRVTLPARAQAATWSEDIQQCPWPPIYQEFLDLVAATGAMVKWSWH